MSLQEALVRRGIGYGDGELQELLQPSLETVDGESEIIGCAGIDGDRRAIWWQPLMEPLLEIDQLKVEFVRLLVTYSIVVEFGQRLPGLKSNKSGLESR